MAKRGSPNASGTGRRSPPSQLPLQGRRSSSADRLIPLLAHSPTSTLLSTAIAVVVITTAAVVQPALAEGSPAVASASGRLASEIQQQLDHEAAHERLWWNGWMATYAGLTTGQGVAAGLSGDRDTRADLA
jgi:hypothetical protein